MWKGKRIRICPYYFLLGSRLSDLYAFNWVIQASFENVFLHSNNLLCNEDGLTGMFASPLVPRVCYTLAYTAIFIHWIWCNSKPAWEDRLGTSSRFVLKAAPAFSPEEKFSSILLVLFKIVFFNHGQAYCFTSKQARVANSCKFPK